MGTIAMLTTIGSKRAFELMEEVETIADLVTNPSEYLKAAANPTGAPMPGGEKLPLQQSQMHREQQQQMQQHQMQQQQMQQPQTQQQLELQQAAQAAQQQMQLQQQAAQQLQP